MLIPQGNSVYRAFTGRPLIREQVVSLPADPPIPAPRRPAPPRAAGGCFASAPPPVAGTAPRRSVTPGGSDFQRGTR